MATDNNNETVSVLNGLIETCRDGEKGFTTAAEGSKSADLKQFFSEMASQRATFAHELEVKVTGLGGKPADMGHVAAVAHRGWMNIKTAVSGNDDKAILNECERGEDFAKKAFTDALNEALPADLRPMIARQSGDVKTAHDKVRDLRDRQNAMSDAAH